MFWKKRIVRIIAVIIIAALVLCLLLAPTHEEISCLYTNF